MELEGTVDNPSYTVRMDIEQDADTGLLVVTSPDLKHFLMVGQAGQIADALIATLEDYLDARGTPGTVAVDRLGESLNLQHLNAQVTLQAA